MVQTSFFSFASTFIILALSTFTPVEARFGQEGKGNTINGIVQSTGCTQKFTLSGQAIVPLLAAPNPCQKLELADRIIALGTTDASCSAADKEKLLDAAMELVAAEKNFNEFSGNSDSVCLTAGLPKTPELQGILQFVDPRGPTQNNKGGAEATAAAAFNAKAKQILDAAKAAKKGPGSNGASMAQLLVVSVLFLFFLSVCVVLCSDCLQH
jgi:hypothetical protein